MLSYLIFIHSFSDQHPGIFCSIPQCTILRNAPGPPRIMSESYKYTRWPCVRARSAFTALSVGKEQRGDNFVFFHAQTVAVALQVHKQTRVAYHESKNTWGESPKVTKRG